ncbi:MAG TPA: hypothetical protein VN915_04280 [Elusimicrobiota bacterium]|nr:hypothetical protein [Elusimicrobiota bacterium]
MRISALFVPSIAGVLIATSACRNKANTTRSPNLSAPERAFNSSSTSGTGRTIPPEIEVKASSGPVEITLSLYKTKIAGELPWFRVSLKNVGRNKIRVLNEPFLHPYSIQARSGPNNSGTFLEILNAAGQAPWPRGISDANFALDQSLSQPILSDDAHAQIARWRKQGVGGVELARRVRELIQREHPPTYAEPSAFWLEPGASTATVAWSYQDAYEIRLGNSAIKPVGDFAELYYYVLPPGTYRIRAVYDAWVSPDYYPTKSNLKPDEWNVRVKTPFIDFEILR